MRDGGSFSVPEKLDNRAVLHYNTSKMNDSKMKGELGVNPNMEFAIKTAQAYNAVCKPLCQELKLPQTAFDILMFLANNPDRRTASDIVEFRHIKANLVSMNVEPAGEGGVSGTARCCGRPPQDRAALHRKGPAGHRAGPRGAGAIFCTAAGPTPTSRPGRPFSGPWRSSGKIWTIS